MGTSSPYGSTQGNEGARPIRNEIETALEAGRQLAKVDVISSPVMDGVPFVKLRNAAGDERLEYLKERLAAPARMAGTYAFDDVASFLEYWKRYHTDASVCYASMEPAQFVAVIDHHGKKPEHTAYEAHRAVHVLTHSKEWETWEGASGNKFESNQAFAEWLENQVPDVVNPAGANMLEIALNFKVTSNAAFGNQANLHNGKVDFTFTDNVQGTAQTAAGKVSIPEQFRIEIPVWQGIEATKYQVDARFRYRLNNGRLIIWYELIRPHKVIETAFKDVLAQVKAGIGADVLFGKPAK